MDRAATVEASAEVLASLAYKTLAERGQAVQPSHREVTRAVVESAAVLGMCAEPDAPDIYVAVIDQLATRHNWHLGNIVELDTRRVNGFQHKPR